MVALVTFIGVVATTTVSVFVSLDTLLPDLQPREKLGATIDHVAVEHGVDYGEYERRMGYTGNGEVGREVAPGPGNMVFVRVSLAGFRDRSYSMSVVLIDTHGRQALASPPEGVKTVGTCENLSPSANEEGISWRCWHLSLPAGTPYRIRVELYDAGVTNEIKEGPIEHYRVLLDFQETDVLTSPPN